MFKCNTLNEGFSLPLYFDDRIALFMQRVQMQGWHGTASPRSSFACSRAFGSCGICGVSLQGRSFYNLVVRAG